MGDVQSSIAPPHVRRSCCVSRARLYLGTLLPKTLGAAVAFLSALSSSGYSYFTTFEGDSSNSHSPTFLHLSIHCCWISFLPLAGVQRPATRSSPTVLAPEDLSPPLRILQQPLPIHTRRSRAGAKYCNMSTMTVSSTRQPFASVSGARLKNLTNIKNKQNGKYIETQRYVQKHHMQDDTVAFDILPSKAKD